MDAKRYQLIKKLLLQALDLPENERDGFLQKQCGDDSALFNEITDLLNQQIDDGFLAGSAYEENDSNNENEELSGQIGRIKINKLLARGGMGDVYQGTDTLLGRPVAIKILSPSIRMSQARRQAFLNEAKLLSSLHHPNICQVYDFFEDDSKNVLVMELIKGQTLRNKITNLNNKQSLDVAIQIIRALVAAHERGIVHHDLKPENIMLTDDNQIKVLDFGLAQSENINTNKSDKYLSGTPGYMSPEQARGESSDSASDLWSFGLILIEIISKEKPFDSSLSPLQLIENSKQAKAIILQKLPKAEKTLITKLLSAHPKDRPSARESLIALNKIRNRVKKRWVLSLSLLFLSLAITGFWKYTTDLQYQKNLAVREKSHAEKARQEAEELIVFMLDDLNSGLQSVGRLDLMESVARKTAEYYSKFDNKQMQNSREKPALAMIRIAEVLDIQGHKTDAINLLNKALGLLESLHNDFPEDEMIAYHQALAQITLANIYKLTGEFELSQSFSSQSLKTGKKLTLSFQPGSGPENEPNATKRWSLLLNSMYIHADVYMRMGQGEKAVVELEQAVQLAVPAAATNPELNIYLANIQFKRCDTYYDMRLHDLVLEPCTATMEMDKRLLDLDPQNYRLQSNYLMDFVVMSRVYRSLNRFDDAVSKADEGLDFAVNLVNWDPDNSSSTNDYATLFIAKARSLYLKGEYQHSTKVFQKALETLKPLLQDEEEITYQNNAFVVYLHLGNLTAARKIAKNLSDKGFKRSEFLELCKEFNISECY